MIMKIKGANKTNRILVNLEMGDDKQIHKKVPTTLARASSQTIE